MERFSTLPFEEVYPEESSITIQDIDTGKLPVDPNSALGQMGATEVIPRTDADVISPSKRFSIMSAEESQEDEDITLRDIGAKAVKGFKTMAGELMDDFSIIQKTDSKDIGEYSRWKIKAIKDRATLSFTDTPQARDEALNNIYGEAGWKKTQLGVVINPDGLLNAGYINQREKEWRERSNKPFVKLDSIDINVADIADMAGDAPELITAVGTSMATQGVGLIPSILTVASSTGLVKFAQEEIEVLLGSEDGFLPKNPSSSIFDKGLEADTVDMGVTAGKWAGGGEVVARGLGAVGRKVFKGPNTERMSAVEESGGWPTITWEKFRDDPMGVIGDLKRVSQALLAGPRSAITSKIDPAKLETTKEATEMGVTLPVSEAVGPRRNPLLQRGEALAENVFQSVRAKRQASNVEAIKKKSKELIEESGKDVEGIVVAQTGDDADELMRENIEKSISGQEKTIEKLEKKATKTLQQKIDPKVQTKPVEDFGANVQSELKAQAKKINAKDRANYAKIDQLLPKDPVTKTFKKQVSNKAIRDSLKKYLDDTFQVKTTQVGNKKITEYVGLPKEAKQLLDDTMKADKMQSFQAIHASRSRFRNLAYDPDFLKTVDDRFFRIIEKAHDDALSNARLGNNPDAYKALKIADEEYKRTRPLLDNKFMKNLLKDADKGGIQPSQVIGKVENASVEDVAKLFGANGLLSKEGQQEVRDGVVKSWLDKSGAIDDVAEINSGLLLRNIEALERKNTYKTIFGKQHIGLKNLIKELDANNAKVSLKELKTAKLGETKFKRVLEDALKKSKEKDAFMKNNFIKAMTDGDKNAVDYLFRKGKVKEINKAKAHFGENSKEWIAFKKDSMEGLLSSMINHTENIGHIVYKGEPLMNKLAVGTKESMAREIKAIFGEARYKELFRFAKVVTASGRELKLSSGFIASMLALHPFKNLQRLAGLNIMANFLNSPKGIRWLTEGIKYGKATQLSADLLTKITGQYLAPTAGAVAEKTKDVADATIDATISGGKAVGRTLGKLVKNRY